MISKSEEEMAVSAIEEPETLSWAMMPMMALRRPADRKHSFDCVKQNLPGTVALVTYSMLAVRVLETIVESLRVIEARDHVVMSGEYSRSSYLFVRFSLTIHE